MDTSSNNDYCIPVSEPLPGESAIYRRSLSKVLFNFIVGWAHTNQVREPKYDVKMALKLF
jgi:hypothetical protein